MASADVPVRTDGFHWPPLDHGVVHGGQQNSLPTLLGHAAPLKGTKKTSLLVPLTVKPPPGLDLPSETTGPHSDDAASPCLRTVLEDVVTDDVKSRATAEHERPALDEQTRRFPPWLIPYSAVPSGRRGIICDCGSQALAEQQDTLVPRPEQSHLATLRATGDTVLAHLDESLRQPARRGPARKHAASNVSASSRHVSSQQMTDPIGQDMPDHHNCWKAQGDGALSPLNVRSNIATTMRADETQRHRQDELCDQLTLPAELGSPLKVDLNRLKSLCI